ncbi:MAG: hypothetical protein INR73_21535 [Williamsia sp.]|nr:hypothetical protein [Williamsia sp.]
MSLQVLIPNIFYSDVQVGLHLFVEGMGFEIVYSDIEGEQPFYVVKRDGVKVYLVEDADFAMRDRPELRIETDDIESIYNEISDRHPELLHPNLPEVTVREWGAKEFALVDESHVCIVFVQWVSS